MNPKRLAGLALILLAVGCTSIENSLVFQPQPASEPYKAPPQPLQDIHFETADGTQIHARWAPHPFAKGAILYCHGNGGNIEQWGGAVRDLWNNLNESVLIFDYPGYGHSSGKPSESGCYAAAQAAYDWLVKEKKIPPERILIFGQSLGGAVAVDLAARQPHRALVLVRTFTSAPDVALDQLPVLPYSLLMNNRFDSLEKIKMCSRPVFLAAADQDRLISLRHSQRLRDACLAPSDFFLLKNMGHNDPLPPEFYSALRRFVDKH
ncbi:MAG: alpha/beta hydrolase [Gemmataceae bacterium]|nr:alpha/beta hydrolase [Gemmataceae bacterium]